MKLLFLFKLCFLAVSAFKPDIKIVTHVDSFRDDDDHVDVTCSRTPVARRVNCLPLADANKDRCNSLKCCWDSRDLGPNDVFPKCYFSSISRRYAVTSVRKTDTNIIGDLEMVNPSGFTKDVTRVRLTATFCGYNMVRFRVWDALRPRYEVPLDLKQDSCSSKVPSTTYDARLFHNGTFSVSRKDSNKVLFTTDLSYLVFADQYLQLSARIPTHYIYGLGDHFTPLMKSTNWTKYTFFNRDEIPKENKNLYSSFPFYMVMEGDGYSHGVYLFNSNAMDVVLQPAPSVTFRTTGGILDFFIFLGPNPNQVIRQFIQLIGLPLLPPYWSLGFHLSRLGYTTLNNTKKVWKRTLDAGIPFDTQWNDIDSMDRYNDFTYDRTNFRGLPEFVKHLHRVGMHYVLIVDPGISSGEPKGTYPPYDDGMALDVFVKNVSGDVLKTKVWNKVSTVFPDFTNRSAVRYWHGQLSRFHSIVPFDGVWLDMNEPTNFLNGSFAGCPNSTLEDPLYVPGGDPLRTKTICMTAKHERGNHYDIHNIYGIYQTQATYRAMINIRRKRPFILTRAGFPGIGRYAGMWNGDVVSLWEHMQNSIPSLLGYSISGVPLVGADICGFNNNTTAELCARWFALGAFYPFTRNHNSDENIAQDPVALGPKVVKAAKTALFARYFLLPYLYTLLFNSHILGETVMRPLFFEFPRDKVAFRIDRQFLWGPALMIIPALEPDVNQVVGYLPSDIWYNFYTGLKYKSTGQNYTMRAPLDAINLIVRCGFILPAQEVNQTTTASRKNDFQLIVALDLGGRARGGLFWDDGNSLDTVMSESYNLIQFYASENHMNATVLVEGYDTEMILSVVRVYGVQHKPRRVLVNGSPAFFEYSATFQVLRIQSFSASLLAPLNIDW